jgi:hypothetical protein
MSRRALIVAVSGLLAAGAVQAGAAPVADGTISGRVAPDLRPTAGSIADARAIDVSNLTIAGSGSVSTAGTYTLKVPPGVYLVTVDKVGARAAPVRGYARLVRVRSGGRASPPIVTRRPQSAQLSQLAGGKPVVAVKEFAGSGPHAYVGRALADMLTTDLVGSPCVVLVEWIRRAEVLDEIRLQQSKRFDPSTRVRPGRLLQPDIFVEGSVTTTQSSISWNVRMREIRSGRIIASVNGRAGDDLFAKEVELARQLRKKLEELCLPARVEGTFSGELTAGGKTTFTGSILFVREEIQSSPGTVTYKVAKVKFVTTIDGAPACQGTATERVSLANADPNLSKLVLSTERTPGKGYRYFVVSLFQSPQPRQVTFTCNGAPATVPWIPAAALNTGSSQYTDGTSFKGTNNELPPNTYTWNLKGSR